MTGGREAIRGKNVSKGTNEQKVERHQIRCPKGQPSFQKNLIILAPNLSLPASRTAGNKCVLLKPLNLQCSIIAAHNGLSYFSMPQTVPRTLLGE